MNIHLIMADTCLPSLPHDQTVANNDSEKSHHEPKRPQTQGQEGTSDATRTSRLTENKRRYRARQKEYVADLERRLAEARAQGVNATAQVQIAARQVVTENGRLRQLLQLAGFSDDEIDLWAKRDHCANGAGGSDCARRQEIEHRARLCAIMSADPVGSIAENVRLSTSGKCNSKRATGLAGNTPESMSVPSPANEPSVTPGSYKSAELDVQVEVTARATISDAPYSGPKTTTQTESCVRPGPCKLLSRLADNPQSDITQVTAHQGSLGPLRDEPAQSEGDVECKEAYEMLMRYATSEEKMDYVARALETGCISTGQGGCAVKKQVIWEALDGMCG